MISNVTIDTGAPRSVSGHVISGAIAAGAVAGALNYNKYKKEKITKEEAIKNSIKLIAQGGIATGSAIAAANYLGQGNVLGFLSALSIGAAGVYAVEKVNEKIEERLALQHQETELIEEETGE